MGGCSQTGDAKVKYGECQRDSCMPLPCGYHLTDLSQNYSQGALFVVQPKFLTKSVQHSTPIKDVDNILRITLTSNVDIPECIRSTLTVDEPVPTRPWLRQKRELTTPCQRSHITISGLTGVVKPVPTPAERDDEVAKNPGMIRIRSITGFLDEAEPFEYFGICYGATPERTAMGLCDDPALVGVQDPIVGAGHYTRMNTSSAPLRGEYGGEVKIVFTVLKDIPANTPLRFIITV